MLWFLVSVSTVCTLYVLIVVSELIAKLRVFGNFLAVSGLIVKLRVFGGLKGSILGLRVAFIIAKLASLSFKTPRAKSTLVARLGLLSYTVGI